MTPPPTGPPRSEHDLPASTLGRFICADFRATWDAVAGLPADVGSRGNFIFARQAMSLIELAGRTCAADLSGQALVDLSAELKGIEPHYFSLLPGPCARPGGTEWTLPFDSSAEPDEAQLLWALFDLVRHGQAHQYQQIMVELDDQTTWGISLTGALPGRTLASVEAIRPTAHLSQMPGVGGSLWLVVCPEVLFLDFEAAITRARVFRRGLEPAPLGRKAKPGGRWDFDQRALEEQLRGAGHVDWVQADEPETVAVAAGGDSPDHSAESLGGRIRRWLPF